MNATVASPLIEIRPNALTLCLRWRSALSAREPFDLDTALFMLDESGRAGRDQDLVFYNQRYSRCDSIWLLNEPPLDDVLCERLVLRLDTVPEAVMTLVWVGSLYAAENRGHCLDQLDHLRCEMTATETQESQWQAEPDLTGSHADTLMIGVFQRRSGGWCFVHQTETLHGGLATLCQRYGLTVSNQVPR